MYRVGIVGCGGIAQVHAPVLKQLPETELVACADIRTERAQAMAEKFGCKAYASLEEMLANEKLDGQLTVAEETRPIRGGFILADGRVEVNCSFDTLVRLQKNETAGAVAKILFPEK